MTKLNQPALSVEKVVAQINECEPTGSTSSREEKMTRIAEIESKNGIVLVTHGPHVEQVEIGEDRYRLDITCAEGMRREIEIPGDVSAADLLDYTNSLASLDKAVHDVPAAPTLRALCRALNRAELAAVNIARINRHGFWRTTEIVADLVDLNHLPYSTGAKDRQGAYAANDEGLLYRDCDFDAPWYIMQPPTAR